MNRHQTAKGFWREVQYLILAKQFSRGWKIKQILKIQDGCQHRSWNNIWRFEQVCDILKDENIIENAYFQMFIILMAMGLFFLLIFVAFRNVLFFPARLDFWTHSLRISDKCLYFVLLAANNPIKTQKIWLHPKILYTKSNFTNGRTKFRTNSNKMDWTTAWLSKCTSLACCFKFIEHKK